MSWDMKAYGTIGPDGMAERELDLAAAEEEFSVLGQR